MIRFARQIKWEFTELMPKSKNPISAGLSVLALSFMLLCAPLALLGQSNQSPLIFTETNDELVLVGLVRKFDFSSPETLIELEVEGSAGQKILWQVVTESATELRRHGWTSQSLFTGELVQVSGSTLPNSRLSVQLDSIVRANGQVLTPKPLSVFDDLVSGSYLAVESQGSISLSFDHYGFSRSFFYFSDFDASLQLDAENLSNSSFQLDLLSEDIASNSAELTRVLKSGVFFDASNYPLISVQSTAIQVLDDSSLLVLADINIKGRSVPAQLQVKINAVGEHPRTTLQSIGISAQGQVNRSSWELSDFIPEVSDRINIELHMELELSSTAVDPAPVQSLLYPYNQ